MSYKPSEDISCLDHEHIRLKSFYAGAKDVIHAKILCADDNGNFVYKKNRYSLCYFQCVNEIIVNAFDNLVKNKDATKKYGGPTNEIRVNISTSYDNKLAKKYPSIYSKSRPSKGKNLEDDISKSCKDSSSKTCKVLDSGICTVRIKNNGKGLNVNKRVHTDGLEYWNPFLIITAPRTGSNMGNGKISGGNNGLGMKITTYCSNYLKVKTLDAREKRYYEQKFTCPLTTVKDPLIFKDPIVVEDYDEFWRGTEFKFRPDSKFLGYEKWGPEEEKLLVDYVRGMLILLKFYIDFLDLPITVILNDKKINNTLPYLFCDGNPDFKIYAGTELAFSAVNNIVGIADIKSSHINHVRNLLNEKLKDRLTAFCKAEKLPAYNRTKLFANLNFTVVGVIPDLDPSSQRKEVLHFVESKIHYEPSEEFLDKVFNNIITKLRPPKKINEKVPKTEFIHSKSGGTLFITEGKHAWEFMDVCLNHMDRNFNTCFVMQGVPPNTYKQVSVIKANAPRSNTGVSKDGTSMLDAYGNTIIMGKKFIHKDKANCLTNKLIQLKQVLGLEYGQTDFSNLKYKRVVICTDNDEDGKGNICTLLMLFFYVLWPGLFEIGFIQRWETPLIKLTTTNGEPLVGNTAKILGIDIKTEFTSDESFDNYLAKKFPNQNLGDIKAILFKRFMATYFKGLGGHTLESVPGLVETLEDNIYVYRLSPLTDEYIKVFYDKQTARRKNELRIVRKREDAKFKLEDGKKWVYVSNHIKNETKFFHLLKITRALPSYIDGQTISRRKILFYVLTKLKSKSYVVKLGGFVKDKMEYHHGEKSLEETIINLGQSFKGANPVQFLHGIGVFGSIKEGTNSNIQSRYVKVVPTKMGKLVFPKDDFPLLDYEFSEGRRVEPTFMVPVIPMGVLNNRCVPGTGWKHESWARNILAVISYVAKKIKATLLKEDGSSEEGSSEDESLKAKPLKEKSLSMWGKLDSPSGSANTSIACRARISRGAGKAQEEEEADWEHVKMGLKRGILIKELPVGSYVNPFILNLPENIKCFDQSNKKGLKLFLVGTGSEPFDFKELGKPGDKEGRGPRLKLGLIKYLSSSLNYLDYKTVIEFRSYEEVIDKWFEVRLDFYKQRIIRNILVLELRISQVKNIIRFIKKWESFGITKNSSTADWNAVLINFDPFDMSLINKVKDPNLCRSGDRSYLKKLRINKIGVVGLKKYQDLLAKLLRELEEAKEITWDQLWVRELIAIKKCYD